ncbi:alpha/beta hydrolase [Nocardia takedensis]|uniref:alpha/beta hydrolase n=1 Tax=Nocardia takedensis TaxID=259390 RepID=UPI0003126D2B|nr:alpha/beta hydrolase [Nocardia takedensis]
MRYRLPTLIAATAAGVTLATAPVAQAAPTYHHNQDIAIACGTATLHQDSDWFLPAGQPKALVWLQHGFARTNRNVAALATHFAEAGYAVFTPALPFMDLNGCTLQNLTGNRPFLNTVAALFGEAADPTGALATSLAEAARASGHPPITMPAQMVFAGHSAGAEAVTYVADRLRTAYPAAWPSLRGLVLLDPVKSFIDNNTDPSLINLDPTDLPIRAISAAPSACNNLGTGTTSMQTHLHRPYLGVRLTGGVHTDAEGDSSDTLGTLLCGVPESRNVSELDSIAVGWADDYVSGETTARFYPDTAFSDVAAAPGAHILRPF